MHKVILFGDTRPPVIIGEAETESQARTFFSEVYNIDFYDAEDGPRVTGYEPDGSGCFIVDGKIK